MEILYKINKNGIIIKDSVAIPMIEGTAEHNEYVQYLKDGGTVEETDEETKVDIELLNVILPNVIDLNGENTSSTIGITTTFQTNEGLTVTVINGLVVSMK
jgi:hypothetical protein